VRFFRKIIDNSPPYEFYVHTCNVPTSTVLSLILLRTFLLGLKFHPMNRSKANAKQ